MTQEIFVCAQYLGKYGGVSYNKGIPKLFQKTNYTTA